MMMKHKVCIIKVIGAIILTIAIVWLIGRYGWKLVGFQSCSSTGITYISVEENQVKIKGFCEGSFPEGYIGYITKLEDGKLYIGVKYDTVFGCFERGEFNLAIPVKEQITQIYIKTGSAEKLVWDTKTDPMMMQAGFYRER